VREGVCIRLYSEEDFNSRPPFTQPEIQRANLAEVILRMKAFHLGDIDTFPFVQPPTSSAISNGYALLQELGALDGLAEPVSRRATELLAEFAGRPLADLRLSIDFSETAISPAEAGREAALEEMSGGEQEQILLAVRLALAENLTRAERHMVVLDDVLLNTDDQRLVRILDYFHACEHIHDLAKRCYGEGNPQGQRWAREHCRWLKEQGPGTLLGALKRMKPATAEGREALARELGYFTHNRERMAYPQYRRMGLMIGSGPVEAACKTVVGARLKQSGMRWSMAGADHVLAIRTRLLSAQHEQIAEAAKAA